MKRKFLLLFLTISITVSFAQKAIEATDEINIFGLLDKPTTIPFATIAQQPTTTIESFKVTNHLGEFKKEYKNVKVVALLDILQKLNITTTSPKLLSEYYFVFRGSDGYAVVYSWNEIFNTDIGNSIFIVTEADNKKLSESSDRILLISTKDYKTGRRHIKGLKSIEIKRI